LVRSGRRERLHGLRHLQRWIKIDRCGRRTSMKSRALPQHIYHMAEASNWASIQARGLLPASHLLAKAGLSGVARRRLEREQRLEHTALPSGVSIRDQTRMPAKALKACLVGLRPMHWYALLNARVFFWLDLRRLNALLGACRQRPQVVLTLDACRVIDAYREFAAVTPINSGHARRRPGRRGAATFVPYDSWLEFGWASEAKALGIRERNRSHRPVELTIAAAVPDVMRYVVATQELAADEQFDPCCPRTLQSAYPT